MSMDGTTIAAAFNEEAGDAASLAVNTEIWRWFSEGQARLGRYVETSTTLTWAAAANVVALPAGFSSISSLDYDSGVTDQPFRVFGKQLVIDEPGGTSAAGTARLYYWAERAVVDASGDVTAGSLQEDYACIYYALHRFYRKLASNRVQYKRYSTLLGANAVTVSDLQNESDRLLQDFVDARADLPPLQPASFFKGA
jgi:hypothetical protein